jgi:hypothetical protein
MPPKTGFREHVVRMVRAAERGKFYHLAIKLRAGAFVTFHNPEYAKWKNF